MRRLLLLLLAAALAVGAISAPAADAKFCSSVATSTNKALAPMFEDVMMDMGEVGVAMYTACSTAGG